MTSNFREGLEKMSASLGAPLLGNLLCRMLLCRNHFFDPNNHLLICMRALVLAQAAQAQDVNKLFNSDMVT